MVGESGKGRLAAMLQRFYGYTKGSDESIDQIVSTLNQLSNEIYDIAPDANPSPKVTTEAEVLASGSNTFFILDPQSACQKLPYASHLEGLMERIDNLMTMKAVLLEARAPSYIL